MDHDTPPQDPTPQTPSTMVCRLCGKDTFEIQGWLTRVNPKGEAGIWECRPACDAQLTAAERLLGAIEGEEGQKGTEEKAPEWSSYASS
jgi:hypothetical protein